MTMLLISVHIFCLFVVIPTGAEHPTYLKEPGDKVVTAAAFGGIFLGLVIIGRGLYSMANGVNKVA